VQLKQSNKIWLKQQQSEKWRRAWDRCSIHIQICESLLRYHFSQYYQYITPSQKWFWGDFCVTHPLHTFWLASSRSRLYRFYSDWVCVMPVLREDFVDYGWGSQALQAW
jgi:hypothetical protein